MNIKLENNKYLYAYTIYKRGVCNLTNINCSYDCIFQENGLCNLETIKNKKLNSDKDCVYYEKRNTPI